MLQDLFLDSGSFSLQREAEKHAKKEGGSVWDYYESPEFEKYLINYAEMVCIVGKGIYCYANVDVIGNPELTWKNQKRLEKLGASPIPIVHCGTDMKWLDRYLSKYEFIALGGMVPFLSFKYGKGGGRKKKLVSWLDDAFNRICGGPNRKPRARVHGFGVTTWEMLINYPWFSVDSTSWVKFAAYGWLVFPKFVPGRKPHFSFDRPPFVYGVTYRAGVRAHKHIGSFSPNEKHNLTEWLKYINMPLGKNGEKGEVVEPGITNDADILALANMVYFQELIQSLPEYPWKWKGPKATQRGFIV